jgi:hypothetical protein
MRPAFGTSTDLAQRYELFMSVAAALATADSVLRQLALRAEPQQLAGPTGLYEVLDSLPVFAADPQRKKARILVQQLYRYRLINFTDPENVRPATEYHLIRLYLRTERVVHADGVEFATDAYRAVDIRSVNALRLAVEEAMHYTTAGAAMSLPDLNEIEWQIARSFCQRSRPLCAGPPRADKPVDPAIVSVSNGACPFANSCNGPARSRIAHLAEPRLAEHHAFY